jgi:hypothetical protein
VSGVQLLTVSLRTGCGRRIATAKGTRASKTLGDVVEHSLAELGYVEGRNVMFVHRYSGPEVKVSATWRPGWSGSGSISS